MPRIKVGVIRTRRVAMVQLMIGREGLVGEAGIGDRTQLTHPTINIRISGINRAMNCIMGCDKQTRIQKTFEAKRPRLELMQIGSANGLTETKLDCRSRFPQLPGR